jgi:internalin A
VDATEPDKIAAVQQFIAEAKRRSIPIRQDKSELGWGDSLTKFMDRLAQGQKIFVILSNAYLRSPYCTYELFKIWQNCAKNEDTLTSRVRIYLHPGLKIFTEAERLEYFRFWKSKYLELKQVWDEVGAEHMPENDLRRYQAVKDFYGDVMKILGTVSDRLQPKDWDAFINYSFDDTPAP